MNWKKIVSSVAPAIGTALGGPMGGIATKFLADKLMGKPDASERELADFIAGASPEHLARMKELDQEFEVRMRELDIDVERINAEDRESARSLAKGTTLVPQAILASVFVAGFVVVLGVVFTGAVELQDDTRQLANILLGILSAGITQIMNFFFGSSAGSKEKTAKLTQRG